MAASSKLLAGRYQPLGVIGRGATGTVHRAADRLSGRHVALKTLGLDPQDAGASPSTEQPARTAELLAREFRLLAGLHHPNVVVSLDHAFDEAVQSFFTMDLHDNACTLREAASGQPLATKVDLLVQLLHALAYLHRRGLVHRDVKPENALCVGGVVKLIDFGLAVRPGETEAEASSCGTLAYAAPELLRGAPFEPSADLYAVGIIAYEIFTGRHPYDTSSPAKLLQSVFRSAPDFAATGIDPRLADVLRRLLAREPAERFGSAFEVITTLSTALDRTVAAETASTRNSFLHAAGLVGREAEMERLRLALPNAVSPERRPMLIGGESGIGKSRLLDELAVEAKVRGIRVLRGQARREGARPYESWRGVLRHLILLADPSELEAAALASAVPDIATLIGREVKPPPELDPAATHVRLARVLEALLRRCKEPLLIVLEDMQWAGDESLKLFARVQAIAPELRVLLLATYRSDERPGLLQALPGVDHLALAGLGADAIERLCASMIGEGSADPARRVVVERVLRESHGNVFLVLELMRVLADDAGGLERIGTVALPEQIFSGGIGRLVRRRVDRRLSARERAFLRTAAVAGRELDLEVLAAIHPDLDVRASAARAVDAAVLSSAQGRWWFAHDRVRDALVDALPDDERRALHGRIAHAVLALSPSQASTLAHHFGAAGQLEREREFAALAGDQFLNSGAYHDAIPYLRRALALTGLAADRLARAALERKLGEALFRCGQLLEGRESLGAALSTLGRPLPTTRARTVRRILGEARVQVGLRGRRTPPPAATKAEIALFEEAILAYTQLSRLAHHLNDEELVLLVTLSALNLAERGNLRAHHARLAAVMGTVMGLLPVHRWARFYFDLAHGLSARLGDSGIEAFVLAHQGYYEAGIGQWQSCREHLERSMALYDGIGDVRLWEESVSILAYALFYQGELPRSLELYRALERSGEERVDSQIVSWGLTNRLKLLVRSGAIANIEDLLARADGLLIDGITKAVCDGVKVELELVRRDLVAAQSAAGAASARLERAPPRSFMACSTYAAVSEVHLACWAAGTGLAPDQVRRLQQAAGRANRALAKIARVFPIAEPARLLHAGTFESLRGRSDRARALWEEAARVAAARELPLEEALALDALAACPESEDREAKRARAMMLFDRLGTSPSRRAARLLL